MMHDIKRIHVIINPAAGQNTPILATLNDVFHPLGIDWDVSITKKAGDGEIHARAAVERGVDVVAAYGGDGTVAEVASGLIGSDVPLAILPGGTGNVLSVELGIPSLLSTACHMAVGHGSKLQRIDCAQANNHFFLLRLSVGLEAQMVESTTRELKDRYGIFAYLMSAVQNLRQPSVAQFHMKLDGKTVDIEGVTCIVANSGNLGLPRLKLLPTVDIRDGQLDVLVLQQANLAALFEIMGGLLGIGGPVLHNMTEEERDTQFRQSLHCWQAKEIEIVATPSCLIQADGDLIGEGPIRCRVLPEALSVFVPDLPV